MLVQILLVGDTVQKTLPFHKPPLSDALHGAQRHFQHPQQASYVGQAPTGHALVSHAPVSYAPVLDFSDIADEPDKPYELAEPAKLDSQLTHYRHVQAKSIDSQAHRVTLTDGTIFEYDTVLIATGGSPHTPPCFETLRDSCMTYRTIKDYKSLKEVCKRVKTVCIIGGGLLGSELASSIGNIGLKVIQLFNGPGIYCTLLPRYLSDYITEESHKRGVETRSGTVVDTKQGSQAHTLILDNGNTIETEFTVICSGRQPNVEIAESAGLPINQADGGVMVESSLEVAPDIYAAGDIISWKDPIFNQYRRVDHHDHALHSGEIAGKNMCGQVIEYNHQPFFWSDLGFFAFEAVGLINSQLDTVSVWKTESQAEPLILLPSDRAPKDFQFTTGFVYYIEDTHIVGVLLVGMFGKLEQARAMIIQRRITIQKPDDCKNLISFNQ